MFRFFSLRSVHILDTRAVKPIRTLNRALSFRLGSSCSAKQKIIDHEAGIPMFYSSTLNAVKQRVDERSSCNSAVENTKRNSV